MTAAMHIVVLQSVRYDLIGYDRAIDHARHRVVYVGTARQHGQIPRGLPCDMVLRDEDRSLLDDVGDIIAALGVQVDRLIAIVEEELIDAARLRERFGIPGPSVAQAVKVRDKTVMKRCVAEAGIRVPCFTSLPRWLDGQRLPIGVDAPVILKPVDGASSIDVERFDNQRSLALALAGRGTGIDALDDLDAHAARFEVEAFVRGPVMHVDGIARQGRIEVMVPSRYVGTALGYAHGEPFGSVQLDAAPSLRQLVAGILRAVEIRDGAFHLELIEDAAGLVFLEVAHRVGGARVTETFERRTGVHLGVADVAITVDPGHVIAQSPNEAEYFAWFVVPAHHLGATHCRVSGHDWLRATGAVDTLNLLGEDKPVCKHVTYAESALPLAGLLRAGDPRVLQGMLRRLFDGLVVEGIPAPAVSGG